MISFALIVRQSRAIYFSSQTGPSQDITPSLAAKGDSSLLQYYHKIAIMNSQNNYDFLFKYILVGDTNVGKSCFLSRYVEGIFKDDHEPTLGVEFASKIIELEAQIIKTQIWDTAGQESFKAITRSYYKGSIAAFLVFDITSRASFQSLHKWLYEVKNYSHDKIEIQLVGNKLDLKSKRAVSFDEAETFARNNGFGYIEVSAKSGERVDQCFLRISEKILRKVKENQLNPDGDTSMGIRRGKKHIISQNILKPPNPNATNNRSSCCQ